MGWHSLERISLLLDRCGSPSSPLVVVEVAAPEGRTISFSSGNLTTMALRRVLIFHRKDGPNGRFQSYDCIERIFSCRFNIAAYVTVDSCWCGRSSETTNRSTTEKANVPDRLMAIKRRRLDNALA